MMLHGHTWKKHKKYRHGTTNGNLTFDIQKGKIPHHFHIDPHNNQSDMNKRMTWDHQYMCHYFDKDWVDSHQCLSHSLLQ